MKEYVITSASNDSKVLLKYGLNKYLMELCISDCTDEQQLFILKHLPKTLEELEQLRRTFPKMKVTETKTDISFNAFWNEYAYKVGNKGKAEKLYNKLSETEKILAIGSIKEYNKYLSRKASIERLYPETYLNQRRYDIEYSKL